MSAELERIKTALEGNSRAVSLDPSAGRGTATTRARLRDGLTCEVEDGPWRFTADMAVKYGGNNMGPNPGVLGRAALGSCLAIGYGTWAARLGVPYSALEVEIQADYDVRGALGVSDDVRPGYQEVRYVVRIESPAPREEVERMLEIADRRSSWLDMFGHGVKLRRDVHIAATTEGV